MIVLLLLVGLRVALPYVLTWNMNRVLAAPGPYRGHVDGLSLDLWRGAYQVDGLTVDVVPASGETKPLFSAAQIAIALDWRQLLHARIRSSIVLDHPRVFIGPAAVEVAKQPTPAAESAKAEAEKAADAAKPPRERWQERVSSVIAFRIDTLRIIAGVVRYVDERRGVELGIADIQGELRDIAGGKESKPTLATFTLTGGTTGGGTLRVEGRADPWALAPTFDVRAEILGLHLVDLNASARQLKGLVFRKGVFSAYAEAHAADSRLNGYIKPLFFDLDVTSYGSDQDNAATRVFWKAVIVVAENLLPNGKTDALAARIPIKGQFDKPQTDIWTIIGSVLGNAFVSAILPGFEGMATFTTTQ